MLRLFDTLTGQKQELQTREPDKVGIYVCGPTVYDYSHLGHARVYVVFDTVVHEDVKLSEAADRRLPITEYAPDCRGTAEYAAVGFELLTRSLAGTPSLAPMTISEAGSSREMAPSRSGAHPVPAQHALFGQD